MDPKSYRTYSNFLKSLSFKLTRFYYKKLDKNFVVYNKLKGKGYDPVTTSDKAFEKFIRKEIKKNFRLTKLLEKNLAKAKIKVNFHGSLILLMERDLMFQVIQHGAT